MKSARDASAMGVMAEDRVDVKTLGAPRVVTESNFSLTGYAHTGGAEISFTVTGDGQPAAAPHSSTQRRNSSASSRPSLSDDTAVASGGSRRFSAVQPRDRSERVTQAQTPVRRSSHAATVQAEQRLRQSLKE